MIGGINMFVTLTMQLMFPSNQLVVLVDVSTTLPICWVGAIRLKIGIYILVNENVLYVPRLDGTLFSIMNILSITIVHLLEITTNTR